MKSNRRLPFLFALVIAASAFASDPALPPGVVNSQKPTDAPLTPQESLQRMKLPPGFRAQLFAHEPDVMQPIAMEFDDRGRLWVAENFSYPYWQKNNGVSNPAPDRIAILADREGDGKFDQRSVFLDQGRKITSILPGFGGVWVLSVPELLFFPDANGDDVPDGPAVAHLDGWTLDARHNFVNGLAWGPDGWLYGRHGITTNSFVGKPGAADRERVLLNCSIWRYHPVRKKFEVVCQGSTNPWGLDWDEHGQAFFSNNVIGHFWHVLPGANYQRMFGQPFNPHLYELMKSCSDHLHWAGEKWQDTRSNQPAQNALGGGHSHVGLLIYQGDNWPAEWRGRALMGNLHGNRVLYDVPVRQGAGYSATHGGNFLMAHDEWFRAISLHTGPDGGVFVSDWQDLGECHDHDGSHRTSGRIYKITHGDVKPVRDLDLGKLTDAELVKLLAHANEWYPRHAQRVLQERAVAGKLAAGTRGQLQAWFAGAKESRHQVRGLLALHVTGAADATFLTRQFSHANEHVRWWAVRLLAGEGQVPAGLPDRLAALAKSDTSGLVRLGVASALPHLVLADRWVVAEALLARAADAADKDLPLLIWHGLEAAVAADRPRATRLLAKCQHPQVRQFIVRRMAAE